MIKNCARNQVVDILRGIAAVLMILGHSFIVYPVNIELVPWCAATKHFIYSFHMGLFFILAGYVYHCEDYRKFISKKIKRIAIPYFVFGVGVMMLRAFGGTSTNRHESIEEGLFKLFFQGGGYWFLYVSFLIFMIYPFIDKVLSKNIVYETMFCGFLLIIDQFFDVTNFFALGKVVHYLPFFVLGRIVSKCFLMEESQKNWRKTLLAICALVGYMLFDIHELCSGEKLGAIPYFVRAVSICYVIYYITEIALHKCMRCNCGKSIKLLLTDCSRFSLQLYLFNGYLLTAIRIVICNFMKIRSPFIIVISIWIGNLVITLILCKFLLPKFLLLAKACGISPMR